MKIKDLFKKVETYNEVADLMHTNKAKIQFGEVFYSERFEHYNDFCKYVKREYIKEVAEKILSADNCEFDTEIEIEYGSDIFAGSSKFSIELVSNY